MPIIIDDFMQDSVDWLLARIGCITMSRVKDLLTGGKGVTRQTYIAQVASEIITGEPSEQVTTWAMERGKVLQPYAQQAYEVITNTNVRNVGIVYLDDNKRIAASPDGLTARGGMEIKCQAPKYHMQTILRGKNPKEFEAQVQGSMWVCAVEQWDYCSFCPSFTAQPVFIKTVYRDEEMIKRISEEASKAVEEIDELVKLASSGYETQKIVLSDILRNAIETIALLNNEEPEIT